MRRLALLLAIVLVLIAGAAPVAARSGTAKSGPAVINLPNGFRPEGLTSGRGSTFFVGSLVDGAIYRGDFRTGTGSVFIAGAGLPAVGTEYERRHDRLWVAGGASGQVRVYNATTGALLQTYQFTAGEFLNDLVVHRGAVYVTNSNAQQLQVIPLGPGGALPAPNQAFVRPISGDLVYTTGFNANGIASHGRWLFVVQTNKGLLFRVNPATGVATQVDLGGQSVTNGDGVEISGRLIYVVRNQLNLVAVFRANRSFSAATLIGTLTNPALDVPTTGTLFGRHLYVVNARFSTPPTPTTTYSIVQLPRRP